MTPTETPLTVVSPLELIAWLLERGITLTVEGERFRVKGPHGSIAPVRAIIEENREGLLTYLTRGLRAGSPAACTRTATEPTPIFALDVETVNGEPITLQWAGPAGTELHRVSRATALSTLGELLRRHGSPRRVNYLYAHNLGFDLGVCLLDHLQAIWASRPTRGSTKVVAHQMIITPRIHGRKMRSATIRTGGCVWLLIDTMSFLDMKLAVATERLKLPVQKHPIPSYLGQRHPTDAEWPAFEAYAMADAEAARHLGLLIARAHEEFSLPLTVSIAKMAESLFTRRYTAVIPACERTEGAAEFIAACQQSYHGGLNALVAEPGLYETVTELDISSAYPHAMVNLPPLMRGVWRRVQRLQPGEPAAIYRVRGRVRGRCPYGVFYRRAAKGDRPVKVHAGDFELWVNAYELRAALAEIADYEVTDGYVWEPAPEAVNPFTPYVQEIYRRKQETPKSEPLREVYKLLLNSLYGKLTGGERHSQRLLGRHGDGSYAGTAPPPGARVRGAAQQHRFHHHAATLHTRAGGAGGHRDQGPRALVGAGALEPLRVVRRQGPHHRRQTPGVQCDGGCPSRSLAHGWRQLHQAGAHDDAPGGPSLDARAPPLRVREPRAASPPRPQSRDEAAAPVG